MAIEVYFQFEHGVFEKNVLFPFPLVTGKLIGDYFVIRRGGLNCSVRFSYFVLIKKDNNYNYNFFYPIMELCLCRLYRYSIDSIKKTM